MITKSTVVISEEDLREQFLQLRLLIHNNLYTDNNIVTDLISRLSISFNLFSIDYDIQNRTVHLKIKKTNMKKSADYSHTSSYYCTILNSVFYSIFDENRNNIIELVNKYKTIYGLEGCNIDRLISFETIALSYNVTTISDNVVVIYL